MVTPILIVGFNSVAFFFVYLYVLVGAVSVLL